jgi:cellulose synthase/poly-beta-1,6-N-acetylglucosamine synthase-like glycosyltransferase
MLLFKILFSITASLIVLQLIYPFLGNLVARCCAKAYLPEKEPAIPVDFACIITAYKNADIARPLIDSLLKQNYPDFHIYLVADECPPFDPLKEPRLTVIQPPQALRLKAKSIILATENFLRPHTHTVIFDADNLAHPLFLQEINRYVQAGFLCVQGRRTAKNLNSTYAALDSLGEHYKNYIERYVPYLLGGSAVISGSGMATETALYRAYLNAPEIQQGQHQWKKMLQEDKILQNFLVRRKVRIAYARDAVVFDEKVSSGAAVETQRSRWLFSYFQNLPNSGGIFLRGLLGANWMQLYFGFVTMVLPMFIQVALACLWGAIALFFAPFWALALALALLIFSANVYWTLYLDRAPAAVLAAARKAPWFVLRQLMGLFKMGNPNKHFKHTEHQHHVRVEELLGEKQDTHGTPP